MISSTAFRTWLYGSPLGSELVYYTGNLLEDSDPAKSVNRSTTLIQLLDEILYAKKMGLIRLRQEPLPAKGCFQHICVRIS